LAEQAAASAVHTGAPRHRASASSSVGNALGWRGLASGPAVGTSSSGAAVASSRLSVGRVGMPTQIACIRVLQAATCDGRRHGAREERQDDLYLARKFFETMMRDFFTVALLTVGLG
jgi:hypothetical protein